MRTRHIHVNKPEQLKSHKTMVAGCADAYMKNTVILYAINILLGEVFSLYSHDFLIETMMKSPLFTSTIL